MKRKVIQLAGKTFVVSLPSKWARKLGIRKGDEVEVEEREDKLIVSTHTEARLERATLDIREMGAVPLPWALAAVQKSGFDEIEVIYHDEGVPESIHEIVKGLFIGFAVTEQSRNRIVLRSIANELEGEYDTMLRRAFLVTLSMGESLVECLGSGRVNELRSLLALENTNNQLTNFCERILIKKGYKEYRKTCFSYVIVWNLEKVCDNYKHIVNHITSKKPKVSKEIIKLIEDTNILLRHYYEIFYSYNPRKLNSLIDARKNLESKAEELIADEPITVSYIMTQLSQISDFTASIIAVNS